MRLFSADHRSLSLVFSMAVVLAPRAGAAAPADEGVRVGAAELAAAPAPGFLWDEDGAMGESAAAAALRRRLQAAVHRAGVPIAILLVGRRAAARQPLDETARRTFSERHLAGATGTLDAVLLVAAPALRRAVIEAGKGDAGIVPEIDARAITTELQRRFGRSSAPAEVARALSDAADRIAASILATEERRRPLGDDERGDSAAAAARQAEPSTTDGPAGGPPIAAVPRRPMLPVAAGLAVMLLLALGLRQRRRGHDDGPRNREPPRR